MKIEPPAPPAVPFSRPTKGGSASSTASTDAASPPKEAAASGQVRLMPSVPGGSDFDAARVAAIREDIRAGRYQVNPERIADGLIDSVRDLLGEKKP
ncbi:MAG: flagellar biosynthesis anti-sigma factor FlgM [Proteobacteria bacterium]|nr:flagellar biosynthesis anti-sigma factor FlgM [Pseudomonadota bacterium]